MTAACWFPFHHYLPPSLPPFFPPGSLSVLIDYLMDMFQGSSQYRKEITMVICHILLGAVGQGYMGEERVREGEVSSTKTLRIRHCIHHSQGGMLWPRSTNTVFTTPRGVCFGSRSPNTVFTIPGRGVCFGLGPLTLYSPLPGGYTLARAP